MRIAAKVAVGWTFPAGLPWRVATLPALTTAPPRQGRGRQYCGCPAWQHGNAVETIWQFLRQNQLGHRVLIPAGPSSSAAAKPGTLASILPGRIAPVATRRWAPVGT